MILERNWKGRWINTGRTMGAPTEEVLNAPYLRKNFVCKCNPKQASVFLCGLGWHVLYVNGQKVDDRVLTPTASQFDKHVSFIEYDVEKLLKKGKNTVVVLLGNGLFNSRVAKWSFEKAPWRDFLKMLCDIIVDVKDRASKQMFKRKYASAISIVNFSLWLVWSKIKVNTPELHVIGGFGRIPGF